jgi:hypothetical protein
MVGYSQESKAYRLVLDDYRLITSRDVRFLDEGRLVPADVVVAGGRQEAPVEQQAPLPELPAMLLEAPLPSQPPLALDPAPAALAPAPAPAPPVVVAAEPRRSLRLANRDAAALVASTAPDPHTYKAAMRSPLSAQWEAAVADELASHKANGTWDLVPRPATRRPIGCKWVFTTKRNADNSVARHKARLVAKGFSQQEGVDYSNTYSPVMSYDSLRALLSIAATEDLTVWQADVVTAFLIPELAETIYMDQPEGTSRSGEEGLVCRLRKTLYGLKQSPAEWYKRVTGALASLGLQPCSDECIFTGTLGGVAVRVGLFVDDFLVVSTTEVCVAFVAALSNIFPVKDLGEASHCLGFEIVRDRPRHLLHLTQRGKVLRLLEEHGMADAKPLGCPGDPGVHLDKEQCAAPDSPPIFPDYRKLVGQLNYLATTTRPDIAFAVNMCGRYMAHPGPTHVTALKRILHYLVGTANYALTLGGDEPVRLEAYSDADHAGCVDTRYSTSGGLITLGKASSGSTSPISWYSRRQKAVSKSSSEAECHALSTATTELVPLRKLLGELGYPPPGPTVMHEDNQSTIAMCTNNTSKSRTKHFDTLKKLVYDHVTNIKDITLSYCPTGDMLADVFTKNLAAPAFQRLRGLLGMRDLATPG